MKLNERHKAFADEYLKNGMNGTQAYLSVYKSVTKESTAKVCASKLLTNVNLKAYIDSKIEKAKLSNQLDFEWLVGKFKTVAESLIVSKKDEDGNEHIEIKDSAGAVSSLKEIGKLLNHYPAEKKSIEINLPTPIKFEVLPPSKK